MNYARLTLAIGFCYARRAIVSTTTAAFYLLAVFTAGSALGVALTHNIVYSAFALMGALLGTAGIFVLLGADFLGAVQLLVYVGGILVLSIFAVMLTHRIADVHVSNRSVGRGIAAVLAGMVLVALTRTAVRATWVTGTVAAPQPTTYGVGNAFLTDFILPFEIASLVLLVVLIGAVMVSRKEVG